MNSVCNRESTIELKTEQKLGCVNSKMGAKRHDLTFILLFDYSYLAPVLGHYWCQFLCFRVA